MCIGSEALPSSLSVLRTLRSVLTGSLGPLGRISRMVCCMYYTDVFVGQTDNIEKLKKALKAELNGFDDSNALTQLNALASGLGNFIGYDSGVLTDSGIGKKDVYSSSYDSNATWKELCKKCKCNSNSSRCSCKCPSSSVSSGSSDVCDPKSCCDNCDVRKAAKIFLGFLPSLYYALKYLYDKCEKDNSWRDNKINESSLGRFLRGMGYDLGKLDENKKGSKIFPLLKTLFNGSNPLQSLYEKSKKYFTSSSHSPVPSSTPKPSQPETVRDILLWLSGLPFTSGFEDLLKHCKGLCDSVNSVQFNDFKASLFDSCFLLPVSVLTVIQRPGTSEVFPSESFINSKFFYPEDPFDLFNMLFDYVRKVFPPLKFLCLQCERKAAEGGWASCTFGQRCADALKKSSSFTSSSSGFKSSSGSGCSSCSGHETYLCTANSTPDVHSGHCLNGQCLGSDSGTCKGKTDAHTSTNCKNPCPHPLLRFLLDGSEDLQNFPTLFQPPEGFPKMGFKENLSSTARDGWSLYHVLKAFCQDGFYPLTRLVQFILCVSRYPPETLGEFFCFL
ncbi:variant erythrocyte surface antigen-1, beta subunit [Babesia divergens]|uniref:Variant erythrocyte surface antigen-1, beta subunit n=1 Tax=Babesia divergens TaxID=32595 RepID=A0AAD9LEY0_BABDI|nr:variant erythrocyte surface antigen-1, beta subunit [Babesia divergens]